MKIAFSLMITLLSFASGTLSAQICNSKLEASTPDSRFHFQSNGTVKDTRTGLQWKRCNLGQVFDNGKCRGEAHYLPWAIASLVVDPGWRLPSITELSSLVELRCINPSINKKVFPGTILATYWSATRFRNTDGNYWQVHFLHGESGSEPADTPAFVRLVRDSANN